MRIPQELLDAISLEVEDVPTLKCLSLWRVAFLQQSPRIAGYINNLELDVETYPGSAAPGLLMRILPILVSVTHLELIWGNWSSLPHDCAKAILAFCERQHLQYLRVEQITMAFYTVLRFARLAPVVTFDAVMVPAFMDVHLPFFNKPRQSPPLRRLSWMRNPESSSVSVGTLLTREEFAPDMAELRVLEVMLRRFVFISTMSQPDFLNAFLTSQSSAGWSSQLIMRHLPGSARPWLGLCAVLLSPSTIPALTELTFTYINLCRTTASDVDPHCLRWYPLECDVLAKLDRDLHSHPGNPRIRWLLYPVVFFDDEFGRQKHPPLVLDADPGPTCIFSFSRWINFGFLFFLGFCCPSPSTCSSSLSSTASSTLPLLFAPSSSAYWLCGSAGGAAEGRGADEGAAKSPVGPASAPTPVWTSPVRSGPTLVSSAPPPAPPTYAGGGGHDGRADTDPGVAKLFVSVLAAERIRCRRLCSLGRAWTHLRRRLGRRAVWVWGAGGARGASGVRRHLPIPQSDPFTPATPVSPSHQLPSSKRRAQSSDPPMGDDRDRGKSKTRNHTRSTTRHDRAPSMAPPPPPPLPSVDHSRSLGLRPRTAPPRGDVYGSNSPARGQHHSIPSPYSSKCPTIHTPRATVCPLPLTRTPNNSPRKTTTRAPARRPRRTPCPAPARRPAPPPQPTHTRNYSVQLAPPLPQQVHTNSYPYAPAYPPPRYGSAPLPGYQQQPQPQQPQPMYMYAAQPPRAQTPGPMSTRGREVPLLKRVFGFGMGKSREGSGRSKSRDSPRRGDSLLLSKALHDDGGKPKALHDDGGKLKVFHDDGSKLKALHDDEGRKKSPPTTGGNWTSIDVQVRILIKPSNDGRQPRPLIDDEGESPCDNKAPTPFIDDEGDLARILIRYF
ncbi:hypothetical protein B0H14DRAFT_3526841 [Mycena olivaceomarginata]|nr:hypothetical protein B0H14DRAFT_3526841 [Mycena olivaceomarginata]